MRNQNPGRRRWLLRVSATALCLSLLALSGCTFLGVIFGKIVPPPLTPAQYAGFKNESISVMAWAVEGTLIDFPDVRLDLAAGLQNKLLQAQTAKAKEFEKTTFPVSPASVVKLQENHPEYEAQPITDTAPKLNTSRVIYVELENLQTRSDKSVELYRGSASATVKVIEVVNGKSKVAYEESRITAVFPPNAREEGTPNGNDFSIYRGTIDALTSEIAKRFVSHEEGQ